MQRRLRVDETVSEGKDEAGDPRIDHVRPVHGGDHEGNGEDGPTPTIEMILVAVVLLETHATVEAWVFGSWVLGCGS